MIYYWCKLLGIKENPSVIKEKNKLNKSKDLKDLALRTKYSYFVMGL